jgi:osmotically-inducible protein OsmY
MSQKLPSDQTSYPSASDVMYLLASDTILQTARQRLRHSSYPQLWKLTCDFHEGLLTLRGVVGSYFIKQLACAAVADVDGVEEVADLLEVRYSQNKTQ